MLARIKKAFRDHIFKVDHSWEMRITLSDAPYRITAESEGLEFSAITQVDDPRMQDLRRDFPKQSRTFNENFEDGCMMVCVGDGQKIMGFFVIALQDYFDKECFKVTFPAGQGHVYAFNFYVDPDNRKSPVARVILTEGFAWLRAKGYTSVTAICRADAPGLVRLYKQFGFKTTGRGIDLYSIFHYPKSVWTDQKTPAKRPPRKRD